MVIVTSGEETYVLFLYRDIQWATEDTSIGFNAGDGIRGFNLAEASQFTDALSLERFSNVELPGAYYFRVDQDVVILPSGLLVIIAIVMIITLNNIMTSESTNPESPSPPGT